MKALGLFAILATIAFTALSLLRLKCHFDMTCLHARDERGRLLDWCLKVQTWQRICLALAVISLVACLLCHYAGH